jgi:hypothetical protein
LYLPDEAGQPVSQYVTGHRVQTGSGKIQEMHTFDSQQLVSGSQFGSRFLDFFRRKDVWRTP